MKNKSDVDVKLPKALIYARVSSERQKNEGHGLDSQEHRCREYAKLKGYEVEAVFKDSFSGGGDFMKRPAMRELLEYIDSHPFQDYVVIFDDLKRFARDKRFHWDLKAAFKSRNTLIECLNFRFEDTPEGEFIEAIFAAQGELEREQNRRQVLQKQKARFEAGYWPLFPPVGYTQMKDPLHGKLLTPTSKAGVIKEAFEGFASGRFKTQTDVRDFLQEMDICDGRPVYLEYVRRLFNRSVYAGWIEYEPWGVTRRVGHHQPLISTETFDLVQQKMTGRTFKRVIDREEFPLKGLLVCSCCKRPFTAGWSKGRTKKYPYYKCQHKYCHGKDVRKEKIEGEYEEFLRLIQPKLEAVMLTERVVQDVWNMRLQDQDKVLSNHKRHHEALVREKGQILDKIVRTENQTVLKALEARIERIEGELKETEVAVTNRTLNEESYGIALKIIVDLLKKPIDVWENGGYNEKRLVTRLVFSTNPIYDRETGYGTADLSIGVRLFEQISTKKTLDVEMGGIEPPSENGRSTGSTMRSRL